MTTLIKEAPEGLVTSTGPVRAAVEQQLQIIVRHSRHGISRHLQRTAGSKDIVEGVRCGSGDGRLRRLGRLRRNLLPLGRGGLLGGFRTAASLGFNRDRLSGQADRWDGPAAAFLTPAPAATTSAAELRRDAGQRSDPERYLPERYLPERALRD